MVWIKILGIQNPLDPSRPLHSPPGASHTVPSQTRNSNDVSRLLGPRRQLVSDGQVFSAPSQQLVSDVKPFQHQANN